MTGIWGTYDVRAEGKMPRRTSRREAQVHRALALEEKSMDTNDGDAAPSPRKRGYVRNDAKQRGEEAGMTDDAVVWGAHAFPEGTRLLGYLTVVLLYLTLIFFPLELLWADDPTQKVVLAPLAEESFKMLVAMVYVAAVCCALQSKARRHWSSLAADPPGFDAVFVGWFVPSALLVGMVIGLVEGSWLNVMVHCAVTSLGAVVLVLVFSKVLKKSWTLRCKLGALLGTMALPMLLHSLGNQFLNISYADAYPRFAPLVGAGRFLRDGLGGLLSRLRPQHLPCRRGRVRRVGFAGSI